VLASEHLLGLRGFHFGLERIERLDEIAGHVLALLGPLEEDAEVVDLADERTAQLELVGQLTPALQETLSGGLILPEVGLADASLDLAQFVGRMGRVKDSSAGRERASADLQNGGSDRHRERGARETS
jgi:hypothetical protein